MPETTRQFLLSSFFARTWFYFAVALIFILGWYVPGMGQWLKDIHATSYLVALAFFINGFTLSTTSLIDNLRRWQVMVVALCISYGISPGVVMLARHWFPGGNTPLAIGFQLLSTLPITLVSAVVLTRMAGGNGAIALYITVLGNIVSIIVVPVLMAFALGREGAQIDVWGTSQSLALTVLLPTVIGQLARQRWRDWVVRHTIIMGTVSQGVILLFILTGMVALQRGAISGQTWLLVIVASLGLHLLLLGFGELAGRALNTDQATRKALVFCSGQKTLALAVLLWEKLLMPLGPDFNIAILPCVVYYIIELVLDGMLAQWWGHRHQLASQAIATAEASA